MHDANGKLLTDEEAFARIEHVLSPGVHAGPAAMRNMIRWLIRYVVWYGNGDAHEGAISPEDRERAAKILKRFGNDTW